MLSPAYELFQPIDLNTYFGKEIDERLIHENYNFDLIEKTLSGVPLFTRSEITYLDAQQRPLPRICRNFPLRNTARKWSVWVWI